MPLFEDVSEQLDLMLALTDINILKGSGERYLPPFEAETEDNYAMRLNNATLFPFFQQNLMNATSILTRNGVEMEPLSPQQEVFVENVDLTGRDVDEWFEDTSYSMLLNGIHYVLADTTGTSTTTGRVFWADIPARNVLKMKTERIDDAEILAEFIYYETITGEEGEQPTSVDTDEGQEPDRIRRYYLVDGVVNYQIYDRIEGDWQLTEEDTMQGFPMLPIVAFYGGQRTQQFFARPPFFTFGQLCLRHYVSMSEQIQNLTTARVPILQVKGYSSYDDNDTPVPLVVSPNSIITSDRADFEMSYVETSGGALAQGEKDLDRVEKHIVSAGIGLSLEQGSGDKTATQTAIETAQQHALIEKIAHRAEGSMTQLMALTALLSNDTNIPVVDIDITIKIDEKKEVTDGYGNGTRDDFGADESDTDEFEQRAGTDEDEDAESGSSKGSEQVEGTA